MSTKKIISVAAAALMTAVIAGAAPTAAYAAVDAPADFSGLTIEELMEKFPQDKYWNHDPDQPGDPNSWTDTPCTHHGINDHYIYLRDHGCNDFTAHNFISVQCDGFARKLAYDVYGEDCRYDWEMDTDLSTLKAGDVIRYQYDGHAFFVLDVEGETVKIAECNWGAPCIIDWTRTESKSSIAATVTWVAHAPFEAPFHRLEAEPVKGDVNCDGDVNIADMVLLQKYLLGSDTLTEEGYGSAEFSGDERVTVFDLILLRQTIAETIAE
ncbi:MAG: dockerin type I repeat-containing protein [Ruminococcus sp.]|nr:dockerin type I repeat-containing protein [Ruminococcus sp.]